MSVAEYKELTSEFESKMYEAFALKGAYYVLHRTAIMLEEAAEKPRDRHGRVMTVDRQKELKKEANRIRDLARMTVN